MMGAAGVFACAFVFIDIAFCTSRRVLAYNITDFS
jgi:hypothetical protein